jgi:hypothetical protein
VTTSNRHRLAMPGDPDLDCDVDGLTVTAVVSVLETREVLVRMAGGFGMWVDSDTAAPVEFAPGDPDAGVETVEVRLRLPEMDARVFGEYVGLLEEWRDSAVPLHMTSAPGRCSLLFEDQDRIIPLPRRPDPEEN